MSHSSDRSRRAFVQRCLLGTAACATLALAGGATESRAAEAPLVSPSDPAAKKVKYVEDASKAKEASGNKCSTCGLYQGANNSKQGPCQIFPGKQVKADGWCAEWAPQM
jgi:High potential iron-sulfur protein